jgi:predicted dehydrogenase
MAGYESSRRGFLRRATVGFAGVAPLMGRPATRVRGANDRIQVGHIGVGGNGNGMLRGLVRRGEETGDVRVVAACDVYSVYRERARANAGLEAKDLCVDYRDLLARDDIDAVAISTPDHWHARMAIDAMAAGKDVYLQKPMTLTTEEARKVAEAAARYERILQVGSQHLSDPRHHKARELIEAGEIGELLWAQGTYSRNSRGGEWNYRIQEEASPETVDWDRWLGPASKRPFSAERLFRWRKYWDYSGGIATDLFYHKLGPLLYAMGPQFPTRVTGSGGVYVQKDREVPDTYATVIEYPNFYINLSASMANAAGNRYFPEVIYGQKGTIVFERNRVVALPERAFAPPTEVEEVNMGYRHMDDFLSSMRSRKQPVLHAEFGYQIMAAIKMGVDSYREGKVKFFDLVRHTVSDRGPGRPGYEGTGDNRA